MFTCSFNPTLAGGSTETTNCKVIGVLYYPDGSPAKNVPVKMRLKNNLADTVKYLKNRLPVDSAFTITNDSGYFEIDTVDTGFYLIEGDDGNNNLALIDSIIIDTSDIPVKVSDTLKPAGAINGTVYLSEGGDPCKVFILAFGLNRFVLPDINGNFVFDNLAEAVYDLRILPSLADYGVLDTSGINVISDYVTDIDTLRLPYIGIPIPKNLGFTYDTLRQIVSLAWSTGDPFNMVKGYNVYRRHIDSSFTNNPINPTLVTDTTWNDSSARQDETYEYKITVVDTGDNEGKMSGGVSVTITCAFELVDSLGSQGTGDGQFTTIWDMCFDREGNLYVVSHEKNTGNNPRIQKFDSSYNFIFGFGEKGNGNAQFMEPCGIAVDDSFNIYVADWGNSRIQKFDLNGVFINAFSGNEVDTSKLDEPMALCIHNNELYVADYKLIEDYSTVKKFDSNGNFILKWGKKGDGDGEFCRVISIMVTRNSEIVTLEDNRIQFFTTSGVFTSKIDISIYQVYPFDIIKDNSIIYLTMANGKIFLLDLAGKFNGIINTYKTDINQIAVSGRGVFVSFSNEYHIKIFQER
jgi:hypothetical protein